MMCSRIQERGISDGARSPRRWEGGVDRVSHARMPQ